MVCEERVFSESEGEKRSDAYSEIFLTNWLKAMMLLFLWTKTLCTHRIIAIIVNAN